MSTIVPQARLRAEVDALAEVAASTRFDLTMPEREYRRHRRDHLGGILGRYLEPRLADPGHPLVISVFGPTGSGKSTLVNTLVGRPISDAGVIRPTTRKAVVWAHRRHVSVIEAMLGPAGPLEIVTDEHPVLSTLAIVDTPDIDSTATEHRRQTMAILEASDMGIAVTTPQRYADAVPWDVLGDLTERSLDVIVVMNRSARRSSAAVVDLAALLRDARVGGVDSADDIIVIQEQRIRNDSRLHGYALRGLARRLEQVANDHARITSRGVVRAVRHAVDVGHELADEVDAQLEEARSLREVAVQARESQRAEIEARIAEGDLVRSEVVTRWQRMIGVSDLSRLIERGARRLTDVVLRRAAVNDGKVDAVGTEVADELVELGLRRARQVATAIEVAWALSPAGRTLVEDVVIDWDGIRSDLAESIRGWQAQVVELVAEAGQGRQRIARAATLGINASAVLVLLGVFASTGGLTGAEVGVAAGAAAAQHAVLERLFGAAAANRLTRAARELLIDHLAAPGASVAGEFLSAVDASVDPADTSTRLREASTNLAAALEEYVDA
jgi:energy-coupling factor transporter ATP-binding protein EcfA2